MFGRTKRPDLHRTAHPRFSPLSAGSSVLDDLWIVVIILEQPAYALEPLAGSRDSVPLGAGPGNPLATFDGPKADCPGPFARFQRGSPMISRT